MAAGLKIAQKGLLLVALPSLFELLFVFVLIGLLTQAERELEIEAQSKAVIACANRLTRATIDATTAAGAYKISSNKIFALRSDMAVESSKKQVEELKALLKHKPSRLQDLEALDKLTDELLKVVTSLKAESGSGGELPSLASLVGRGKQFQSLNTLVNQLGIVTNSVIADELKIEIQSPKQRAKTRQQIRIVLFAGLAFNIVLAFMLASYFSKSISKRLLIVRQNTERLAQRQELIAPIGGVDEIADLDAAFHKAAVRLAELESFKRQLIGIVSHELKAPLSAMQMNVALMNSGATGELPEKARKKVTSLESNIERLICLINDLLDIEKMEAGKFELEMSACRAVEITSAAVESVAALASAKNISIKNNAGKHCVYADRNRIQQVLINLLSNAIKYSNDAQVVEIELEEIGGCIEFRVKDRGRGIPETHIDKIFDRFQQVEKADESEKGGSGLGLAICKAIIKEHGSDLGVRSKQHEGSTFYFRLKKCDSIS